MPETLPMMFWSVSTIRSLPEGFDGSLIVQSEGFENETDLNEGDLDYLILGRTVAGSEEVAEKQVRAALRELGFGDLMGYRLLTCDTKVMVRSEKWEPGVGSIFRLR